MTRKFVGVSAVFATLGCVLALSLNTSGSNTVTATLVGLMVGANFEPWARPSRARRDLLKWTVFFGICVIIGSVIGVALQLSPLLSLAADVGVCLFGLAVEVARDVLWLAKAADMRHDVYADESEHTLSPPEPSSR